MASLAGPLDSGMVLKAEVRWDWLNIFASLDTPIQLRKEGESTAIYPKMQ